jgi:hypothetical protein
MRVWILSRLKHFGWDEIEAVFVHQHAALAHQNELEKDFPDEEYAIESLTVYEGD